MPLHLAHFQAGLAVWLAPVCCCRSHWAQSCQLTAAAGPSRTYLLQGNDLASGDMACCRSYTHMLEYGCKCVHSRRY
jgi:hypothetical protein